MHGRQGSHAAYNVQMVVDDKNGFIVQGDAVNEVNDRRQLDHQITQANQILGIRVKRHVRMRATTTIKHGKILKAEGLPWW